MRGRRWAIVRRNSNEWPFLLQGIGGHVGRAVDGDGRGVDFGRLALAGRRLYQARDRNAATGRKVFDFRLVVRQAALGDHLHVAEAGAVVDFQETEAGLRVAAGADPAVEDHFAADRFGPPGVGNGDESRTWEAFSRGGWFRKDGDCTVNRLRNKSQVAPILLLPPVGESSILGVFY